MQKYLDPKYGKFYMQQAQLAATNSTSPGKRVGACIVLPNGLISLGWNGTPSGFSNDCKDSRGNNKNTVIHAEMNALKKLVVAGQSTVGGVIFCTHGPCVNCAVQLVDLGLSSFIYVVEYKDPEGVAILREAGVTVKGEPQWK